MLQINKHSKIIFESFEDGVSKISINTPLGVFSGIARFDFKEDIPPSRFIGLRVAELRAFSKYLNKLYKKKQNELKLCINISQDLPLSATVIIYDKYIDNIRGACQEILKTLQVIEKEIEAIVNNWFMAQKKLKEKESKAFEIYIDGSSRGNPGVGGYACVLMDKNKVKDYSYYASNYITNNCAELKAMLLALDIVNDEKNLKNKYIIYTDSAYVYNIVNDWIYKWAGNGWKKNGNKQIENLVLIQKIYEHLIKNNKNFSVKHCKGHSGVLGNELADALASGNIDKFNKYYTN